MVAATFDTLKFVRRLRADDTFTPQQAERLADALSETAYEDLATKGDVGQVRTEIRELRTELKGDIALLRAELHTGLSDQKTEFRKWLVGAVGLQTVVLLGALIALTHGLHP